MKTIDDAHLAAVTGGVELATCRWLSRRAEQAKNVGWSETAQLLRDQSDDCRAAYRDQHPGLGNLIRSYQ